MISYSAFLKDKMKAYFAFLKDKMKAYFAFLKDTMKVCYYNEIFAIAVSCYRLRLEQVISFILKLHLRSLNGCFLI